MDDNKPTENLKTYEDPFSDHPRHPRFLEPTSPRPYESSTNLSFAEDSLHDPYEEDEFVEKQPLNTARNFSGGFYPPPWVGLRLTVVHKTLTERWTFIPSTFSVPLILQRMVYLIDPFLLYQHPPTVSSPRGGGDRPSNGASHGKLNSSTEISSQNILSRHLSTLQ